jgi:hypothetical protein
LLKAPILLMGIGLLDENAHVAKEKVNLDNLHHGTPLAAHLHLELAK